MRIREKPADDFFANLQIFQSRCQKYNFHLFWLRRGMLLALNKGCFTAVTLFSASLCLCGFGAEVGPSLIPLQTTLQIPLCFRVINPKEQSLGAASWMNPSGFTPCHCVCIWTVTPPSSPSSETPDKHIFTVHVFEIQPSRVEMFWRLNSWVDTCSQLVGFNCCF